MGALVLMFEGVSKGVRRTARAFDDEHEPRRQWRLGLAWASAAVVWVLLLALVRLAFVFPPSSSPEPLSDTPPVFMTDEVPTAGALPPLEGTSKATGH